MPAKLPLFTASSIHRVLACPASAALPQEERHSPSAKRGSAKHWYMQRRIEGIGRAEALLEVEGDIRRELMDVDIDALLDGVLKPEPEVAYAFHVQTGRVRRLGVSIQRDYQVEEGEVPGTVDVVGRAKDGTAIVVDWKFGSLPVTPAERNPQIQFAALCSATDFGSEFVEGRIVQIDPKGRSNISSGTFDFLDLSSFRNTLKKAYQDVLRARELVEKRSDVDVFPGEHCRFCPAETSCPKNSALSKPPSEPPAVLTWMTSSKEELHAMALGQSPEQRGELYAKLEELEALLERVKTVYRDLAKDEPIPLPSGQTLEAAAQSRANAGKLEKLALSLGATVEELAACRGTAETRLAELAKGKGATTEQIQQCKEMSLSVRKTGTQKR